MGYNSIVISSGHGLYVRGAAASSTKSTRPGWWSRHWPTSCANVASRWTTYHDDVSKSQNENLNRIVDFHNAQPPHDLDISVHFNAFEQRSQADGL